MSAHVIGKSPNACVRRALASLHASSCSRDWSWWARLLFSLQSPGTPIPRQTCFILYIKQNKHRFVRYFVFLRADKTTLFSESVFGQRLELLK